MNKCHRGCMTPENFIYWLQGHFEINQEAPMLNAKQVEVIKNHLQLVLNNVTGTDSKTESKGVEFNPPFFPPGVRRGHFDLTNKPINRDVYVGNAPDC